MVYWSSLIFPFRAGYRVCTPKNKPSAELPHQYAGSSGTAMRAGKRAAGEGLGRAGQAINARQKKFEIEVESVLTKYKMHY